MNIESSDLRRIIAATVVTLLALPFLFRNGSEQAPATAAAPGADLSVLRPSSSSAGSPASTGPTTTATIGFLSGPSSTAAPAPILIGVPEAKPANTLEGVAAYRVFPLPWKNLPTPCVTRVGGLPGGTRVTVMNLNNSRTTKCIVATQFDLPPGQIIALADSVFQDIADLIESPIPARISW